MNPNEEEAKKQEETTSDEKKEEDCDTDGCCSGDACGTCGGCA